MENKSDLNLRIDYLHYVEKYFCKPVGELIGVLFPREKVPYEKMEESFKRLLSDERMDVLKRQRLFKAKKNVKSRPQKYGSVYTSTVTPDDSIPEEIEDASEDITFEDDLNDNFIPEQEVTYVGWKVLKTEGVSADLMKQEYVKSPIDESFEGYIISGVLNIRADHIIQSSLSRDIHKFSAEDPYEKELIEAANRWKCRSILDRLYKQHGLSKRPMRRSKQTGGSLKGCKEVMVIRPIVGVPIGKILTIVNTHKLDDRNKKESFIFDLGDEETEQIYRSVPRTSIAPFYEKDGSVLWDILDFRCYYKMVVDDLNKFFEMVNTSVVLFED